MIWWILGSLLGAVVFWIAWCCMLGWALGSAFGLLATSGQKTSDPQEPPR